MNGMFTWGHILIKHSENVFNVMYGFINFKVINVLLMFFWIPELSSAYWEGRPLLGEAPYFICSNDLTSRLGTALTMGSKAIGGWDVCERLLKKGAVPKLHCLSGTIPRGHFQDRGFGGGESDGGQMTHCARSLIQSPRHYTSRQLWLSQLLTWC